MAAEPEWVLDLAEGSINIDDFDKILLSVLIVILGGLSTITFRTMLTVNTLVGNVANLQQAADDRYTGRDAKADWRTQKLIDAAQDKEITLLRVQIANIKENANAK